MNQLLLVLLWVAGFFFLLYVGLYLYRVYVRYSTQITTANGISSLEAITLGELYALDRDLLIRHHFFLLKKLVLSLYNIEHSINNEKQLNGK
ncbi:MAG: hypothetical protein ACE5OZ_01545 [Candidatus Heimdallarchaeota archaeon]